MRTRRGPGDLSPDEVVARLRRLPHPYLGFAPIDHQRALRHHLSDAVAAPGRPPEACAATVAELLAGGAAPVVLSRASVRQADVVRENCPGSTSYPHGDVDTLAWRRRSWPCPRRSAAAPPACPRCWRPTPPASPWSASTTASAQPSGVAQPRYRS